MALHARNQYIFAEIPIYILELGDASHQYEYFRSQGQNDDVSTRELP